VEKYCRAGQTTDDNMAHAHCILDTNTQAEYVISVFHGNNGCTNAPEYYVTRTVPVLSVPYTSLCVQVKNVFTLYFDLMCSTGLPSVVYYLLSYLVWCTTY
jgi:hypothetical protein